MVISVWSVMCKKESAHILMRVHPCIEGRQERAIPSHDRWVSRVLLRRAHFYVGFYVHLYCLNIQEYVYIYYFVIKFFFLVAYQRKCLDSRSSETVFKEPLLKSSNMSRPFVGKPQLT